MVDFNAYVTFDGNCADAFHFYESVLGAKVEALLRVGESPMADQAPPGQEQRVMHAQLKLPGGGVLMGSDGCWESPHQGFRGIALALHFDRLADAEQVFAALADGGRVTVPMSPTFWAKGFGACVDRFGVEWIVNGEVQPQ